MKSDSGTAGGTRRIKRIGYGMITGSTSRRKHPAINLVVKGRVCESSQMSLGRSVVSLVCKFYAHDLFNERSSTINCDQLVSTHRPAPSPQSVLQLMLLNRRNLRTLRLGLQCRPTPCERGTRPRNQNDESETPQWVCRKEIPLGNPTSSSCRLEFSDGCPCDRLSCLR